MFKVNIFSPVFFRVCVFFLVGPVVVKVAIAKIENCISFSRLIMKFSKPKKKRTHTLEHLVSYAYRFQLCSANFATQANNRVLHGVQNKGGGDGGGSSNSRNNYFVGYII